MANETISTKAQGQELADWLARPDGGERELIIEAALPWRKVAMEQRSGRPMVAEIRGGETSSRSLLEGLREDLTRLLHTPPTLLKAARALAVLANSREARELLEHPLVKTVRLNRVLQH